MKKKKRYIGKKVRNALDNIAIVYVNGPRQAGKSTLAQEILSERSQGEFTTMDNLSQLSAATEDPFAFLSNRDGTLVVDEVQLAPELFRPLKEVVDRIRLMDGTQESFGRFLLTGSANIMGLPKLSDALVGRMHIQTLYPLATCEALQQAPNFIYRLFNQDFKNLENTTTSLEQAIRLGTFPEISGRKQTQRDIWFEGYLDTILQRDLRTLAQVEKITVLPRLLKILAAQSGSLVNEAQIARDVGLNPVTGKQYRWLLQLMFLNFDIQPWFRNIRKRLVKAPKTYFVDTLLLLHLLGLPLEGLKAQDPNRFGHILENYVASELLKLTSFSNSKEKLYHYRTTEGTEVDFILERPDGTLAAIEVKSTLSPNSNDFKGLKSLQKATKSDFSTGIVLYPGTEIIPFGENLWAIPISILWQE